MRHYYYYYYYCYCYYYYYWAALCANAHGRRNTAAHRRRARRPAVTAA